MAIGIATWLSCAATASPRLLAENVEIDTPSWSSNGSWVVIDQKKPSGLLAVGIYKGDRRRVTSKALHNEPAWSPVADKIAYVDKSVGGLWLVEDVLEQASPKQILTGPIEIFDGCWSPDGRWIAFVRGQDLRVVNVETLEERLLVEAESLRGVVFPRWLGDSQTIVGSRFPEVVRVDLASGALEVVDGIEGHLFAIGSNDTIWLRGAGTPQLLLRRGTDGAIRRLDVNGPVRSIDADRLSGRVVVTVQGRGVGLISSDGEDVRWLTHDGSDRSASISPGGCTVAFVRSIGEANRLQFLMLDEPDQKDATCD